MLSEKLKSLRLKRNLTQLQCASILNISQRTYSSYETNVAECNHKTLKLIADFFNVTTDYLLDRTNEQKIEKDSTMQSITYKEKALLEEYRKCDDFGKAQSFGYVKALAKGTEQNFNDITKLENKEDNNNSNNKIS